MIQLQYIYLHIYLFFFRAFSFGGCYKTMSVSPWALQQALASGFVLYRGACCEHASHEFLPMELRTGTDSHQTQLMQRSPQTSPTPQVVHLGLDNSQQMAPPRTRRDALTACPAPFPSPPSTSVFLAFTLSAQPGTHPSPVHTGPVLSLASKPAMCKDDLRFPANSQG